MSSYRSAPRDKKVFMRRLLEEKRIKNARNVRHVQNSKFREESRRTKNSFDYQEFCEMDPLNLEQTAFLDLHQQRCLWLDMYCCPFCDGEWLVEANMERIIEQQEAQRKRRQEEMEEHYYVKALLDTDDLPDTDDY